MMSSGTGAAEVVKDSAAAIGAGEGRGWVETGRETEAFLGAEAY